jgi:hypothetical protein
MYKFTAITSILNMHKKVNYKLLHQVLKFSVLKRLMYGNRSMWIHVRDAHSCLPSPAMWFIKRYEALKMRAYERPKASPNMFLDKIKICWTYTIVFHYGFGDAYFLNPTGECYMILIYWSVLQQNGRLCVFSSVCLSKIIFHMCIKFKLFSWFSLEVLGR